jgi:hypothetical protein
MVRCSDLRIGGRYRYVHRAPNGHEVAFRGDYREIMPPRQIVRTFLEACRESWHCADGILPLHFLSGKHGVHHAEVRHRKRHSRGGETFPR